MDAGSPPEALDHRRERGVTRLGRLADRRLGRQVRDRLVELGALWPILAVRPVPQPELVGRLAQSFPPWLLLGVSVRVRDRLVSPLSDVCIEGFPRSANTYAVSAFRRSNPGARIAHHLHAAFQVHRAVALRVPSCVLARTALETVAAVAVMDRGRASDDAYFRSYIRFYRRIAEVRRGFVVCRFEEVVADPGVVVARLNDRFGTSFDWRPLRAAEEREILTALDARARTRNWRLARSFGPTPSAEKEERKAALLERLARNPLLAEATAAYTAITGDA